MLMTVRQNDYNNDKYAEEFGIKISDQLAVVETRVLLALRVYKLEPVLPPISARPDQVERVLKARFHEALAKLQPQSKELDLLVLILPDVNWPLYGDIKRICETDLGVISQGCLAKHAYKKNPQYLENVALNINVKVGGRNTVLIDAISGRISLLSDVPTIIFGADVTHPHPREDLSPSIAAVVASQDWPEVTKYAGLVCAQEHHQELIQELYKEWEDPVIGKMTGGMVKELLLSFYSETMQKPQRIIFYRDGVSEGQFYQVLLHEIDAIRKELLSVVDSKICHPTEFDFYLCNHASFQGTSRPAHYHVLWDENKFTADGLQSLTNNICYT